MSTSSSSSSSSSSLSLSYLRPPVAALKRVLDDFVQNECLPAEAAWDAHLASLHGTAQRFGSAANAIPPCLERLKSRAKTLGLWNLFIPQRLIHKIPVEASGQHAGAEHAYVMPSIVLTYREYGIFCESLGRCPHIAPEACNCSAPDTGNMEVLLEFGTPLQQQQYLIPLLRGEMRSTFCMTEPHVASSDATNLATRLVVVVKTSNSSSSDVEYILQGEKWWSSGAMDPRCRLALVVAKMDYSQQQGSNTSTSKNCKGDNKHGAHTIVAVPLPHPQVEMKRPLTVFGYDDAPVGHAHVALHNVRLQTSDLIAGEGSGFRVAQARLGPGRIHHCMRAIGMGTFLRLFFVIMLYIPFVFLTLKSRTHYASSSTTLTSEEVSGWFFFLNLYFPWIYMVACCLFLYCSGA
jgi:acyl-CoA dehydrogenase